MTACHPSLLALLLLVLLVPPNVSAQDNPLDLMTNPSERSRPADDVDRVVSPEERKKYVALIRTVIVTAFVAELKKLQVDEKVRAEFIQIVESADFDTRVVTPRVEKGASLLTMRDINSIQRGGQLTPATLKKIEALIMEIAEAMIATYKVRHNIK